MLCWNTKVYYFTLLLAVHPVSHGSINPDPGAQTCIECPRRKRSNEARTACVDLPLANLNYSSPGGIAVLVFGALGIIATLTSFAAICRFWNTPIVRACNRKLSLALLAIILLMFSLAFMNLFEPTGTICTIIYPWRYINYNLCLSLLLVKVLRISSAFEIPIAVGLTKTLFTNRMQAVILTTLQAFLLIVLLPWSLLDPPVVEEYNYPEHYAFIKCKADSMPLGKNLFLLNCSFIFLQILLSAFSSFKIRNVPEDFGEAKRIAFSMYIYFYFFAYLSSGRVLNECKVCDSIGLCYNTVECLRFSWLCILVKNIYNSL